MKNAPQCGAFSLQQVADALSVLLVRLEQPCGECGQQEDCADHVQEEHEREQDAHVGLELQC
jgi:hypothetical protein